MNSTASNQPATKPAHTPTPWKVNETLPRSVSDSYGCAIAVCQLSGLTHFNPTDNLPEAKANAALIVRAVNSHAELLRVLKLLAADAKAKGVEPVLIGMVEDAIFKAEGGK